jgi:hypothetical protein
MTYAELPKPTRDTFPKTFRKYEPYFKEELNDWFAVILSLIASAQNMASVADEKQLVVMEGHDQPIAQAFLWSLLSAETIDALCLKRDEWDKTVPNPDVTRKTMEAILSMGLNGLRGTRAVDPWCDALNRVAKGTGFVFFGSVGGKIVVELMGNIGTKRS